MFLLWGAGYSRAARGQAGAAAAGSSSQVTFLAHQLGNDHAEAITTLDMDGDGLPDLLSGAYWYQNPGALGGAWIRHQFREVGTLGEFVSDSGEWTIDVNHDGRPDLVTTGWMLNGLWWFENPGFAARPETGMKVGQRNIRDIHGIHADEPAAAAAFWKPHKITDSYDTEGGAMADINGDGRPDIVLAHYNHSGILWVDFSGSTPKVHHVGASATDSHGHIHGQGDGHGIGVADIDGDGKADILTPFGWFGNLDADHDQWQWHNDWQLGDAGFPILAYDVNHDGKLDLIYGEGHSYGLYWLEQQGSGAARHWLRHTIEASYSQLHALRLVDLDGDGVPELVTGKRYRGHNGGDPGSYDPLVIYYYKLDRPAHGEDAVFTRYPIAVNSSAGIGTQIVAQDLDGDGDVDLATAGKTGVLFFENLRIHRIPNSTREQQLLLNPKWPFPGEGHVVHQENGP